MPKGYWIVGVDVSNPDGYAEYVAFVRPFLEHTGGRFLIRGGAREVPEGASRNRNVVIEFDSYDAAVTAYNSDEYQAGMQLRLQSSAADFVIIEGL